MQIFVGAFAVIIVVWLLKSTLWNCLAYCCQCCEEARKRFRKTDIYSDDFYKEV